MTKNLFISRYLPSFYDTGKCSLLLLSRAGLELTTPAFGLPPTLKILKNTDTVQNTT